MKRYSGIIVRFDDKYLLCKRNYKGSLPGIWSIPGGHMEDNETPENCARREFFEETAHEIPKDAKLFCIDRYFADKRMYFLFLYRVDKKFVVKIDWEHEDLGWFTKDKLPEPIAPQIFDAISRV